MDQEDSLSTDSKSSSTQSLVEVVSEQEDFQESDVESEQNSEVSDEDLEHISDDNSSGESDEVLVEELEEEEEEEEKEEVEEDGEEAEEEEGEEEEGEEAENDDNELLDEVKVLEESESEDSDEEYEYDLPPTSVYQLKRLLKDTIESLDEIPESPPAPDDQVLLIAAKIKEIGKTLDSVKLPFAFLALMIIFTQFLMFLAPNTVYSKLQFPERISLGKPIEFVAVNPQVQKDATMEFEKIIDAYKLGRGIEALHKKSFVDQLLTNKWEPVQSQFVNVTTFLKDKYRFESSLHQFMYTAKPRFDIKENEIVLRFEFEGNLREQIFSKGKFCDDCLESEWRIENGILYMTEYYNWVLNKKRSFIRAYYIPTKDLYQMA